VRTERLGLPEGRWLESALALNFHPAAYIHDSWLEATPHRQIVQRLRQQPTSQAPLSRYLIQTLELGHGYCDDFSTPFARLALIDGDVAQRLYLYIGLTLRSDELRRQILGDQVRGIKRAIGAEAYAFGVRTAPLLGRFEDFSFEPGVHDPATRFALIGARYCWSRLSPKPGDPLLRRALLKLPSTWGPYLATAWDDPGRPDPVEALPPLVHKILKEILPRWRPLFD